MAEFMVIRLGSAPEDPVSWIAVDDRGTRRGPSETGTLDDAARSIGERSVIVLVPGTDVLSLVADIPARGSRLLAALPYALEDQLAEDVEDLHFAAGDRLPDGRICAAVVAHERMQDWLGRLSDAGVTAGRLIPDNQGLARTPNTLSLLTDGNVVMFNDGEGVEFVLPGVGPADAIAASGIGDSDEAAGRNLVAYCDAAVADRYEKDWALLRHELASVDVNVLTDGVLPRLAVTAASGAGVNLLQGRYGRKTEITAMLRPWRVAAMLLAGVVLIGFIAKGADYYRLSNEQATLESQFSEEYRRIRPGDSREIADPVGTVSSLMRTQGSVALGPQLFLPSVEELARAVAGKASVRIEAISYRAGVVDVRLSAPDIPTVDGIVQGVNQSGRFTASMQTADRVDDRVNSRIQIREAGA